MIIGQNLYSNANFQRNTGRKVGFGMKVEMDKITKYAGSLGQAITDKAAIEAAKAEIKVLRIQANKGNAAAAKQLAALEKALKDGKIRGTK